MQLQCHSASLAGWDAIYMGWALLLPGIPDGLMGEGSGNIPLAEGTARA